MGAALAQGAFSGGVHGVARTMFRVYPKGRGLCKVVTVEGIRGCTGECDITW